MANFFKRLLMKEHTAHVSACSREWTIGCPEDALSIWCKIDDFFSADERLPYWVQLWPASFVLADWLYLNSKRIEGAYCLDLGCGLGFTALVGQFLGAKVIGVDYEVQALTYARANALRNNVPSLSLVAMDWREPATRKGSLPFIWGSDIMYERRFSSPLINFFDHALTKDGVVWISEPSRSTYEPLRKELCELGWKCQKLFRKEVKDTEKMKVSARVNLWEIRR